MTQPPKTQPKEHHLNLTVVCGNPRAGSRTLGAANALAEVIHRAVTLSGRTCSSVTIDLAEISDQLFGEKHAAVEEALARVANSDLLVVASPVYKGSYTGLLKAFLDWLPHRGLDGVVAVPLTVMGHPSHSMAADSHLRPLLVELGATVPTPSVVLTEQQLSVFPSPIADWSRYARLTVESVRALHDSAHREEAIA